MSSSEAEKLQPNTISALGGGETLYGWAADLFPVHRSITGPGVRETLKYLQRLVPDLKIHSVPSGTLVFDWEIPEEWSLNDAWISNEKGERIVEIKNNNLHVMGYSESVDRWLTREELEPFLYSLPQQPNAIPYVTSYYHRRWGFCLTHTQRSQLRQGNYHAYIDSKFKRGVLNYGELILPGNTSEEVFLSTYICHPSMANNELSGPVVMTAIARWLSSLMQRKYTYRIVFVPETIGSLAYLSRNIDHLKKYVIAGFNVTCIGDERCYSYLPSRAGNTLSDRVSKHILRNIDPNFIEYSWLDRGSDERQYCAPGIDLPVASIMRSKYGEYPEYHTSLDDLINVVTPAGLEGGYQAIKSAIMTIECNCRPRATILGEPQLGKRGLYPTVSVKGSADQVKVMMNFLTYADGRRDLIEIADLIGQPAVDLVGIVDRLVAEGLIALS